MLPFRGRLDAASKSNSSTWLPSRTTTRVSSGWLASISIRFGIKISVRANPPQPHRARARGAGGAGERAAACQKWERTVGTQGPAHATRPYRRVRDHEGSVVASHCLMSRRVRCEARVASPALFLGCGSDIETAECVVSRAFGPFRNTLSGIGGNFQLGNRPLTTRVRRDEQLFVLAVCRYGKGIARSGAKRVAKFEL